MSNVVELDPFFGKWTGGQGVICEHDVAVIVAKANAIWRGAELLWLLKNPSASLARYDLRKSAQCLRDATDRLDQVLDKHAAKEAAE